jgi:hypothetical protein
MMHSGNSQLLRHIYTRQECIYLRDLTHTSLHNATATFVFGHNPRTKDYTHVGAAEMLAGLSQAAYCMTAHYRPDLLVDDLIARCYFREVSVKFSKMLAPETDASLTIHMALQSNGFPRFDFDGFIKGSVETGLSEGLSNARSMVPREGELPQSVQRTLKTFYNNGSELTLKGLSASDSNQWCARSEFVPDNRLRLCQYATTTQLIVGLSQLAFAIVGEANRSQSNPFGWENQEFLSSMGDQALVKLSYERPKSAELGLALDSTIASSKTLRGCKFIRLDLDGDLRGTMDSMLSPRVPVRTLRHAV